MSYKPEKKHVLEMKNVTPNQVFGYGGLWFSDSSSGTAQSIETIGSFDILRNDFTIDTSSSSESQWHITESGTFLVRWNAVIEVTQTPADDDIYVFGFGSAGSPYTPSMNGGVRDRTDVYRSVSNYSISGTAYQSVEQSWVHTSSGGSGGNMFAYADKVTNTQALVDEYIYQRIEITKL